MKIYEKHGEDIETVVEFIRQHYFLLDIVEFLSVIVIVAQALPFFGLGNLFMNNPEFYGGIMLRLIRIIMMILSIVGLIFLVKGLNKNILKYLYTGASFVYLSILLQGLNIIVAVMYHGMEFSDLEFTTLGIVYIVLAVVCFVLSIYISDRTKVFAEEHNIQYTLVKKS